MADFQSKRYGPNGPDAVHSSVKSRPANERMSLCYYDGDFHVAKGGPPAPNGVAAQSPAPTTRLSVLVFADGHAEFEGVGDRQKFQANGPSR
jgi:hypothetical protein